MSAELGHGSSVRLAASSPLDRVDLRYGERLDFPDAESLAAGGWAFSVFQYPAWLAAARRASGRSRALSAVGYAGSSPVLALPLAVEARAGFRALTWDAAALSDYCAPLLSRRHADLLARVDGADMLRRIAASLNCDVVHVPKQPALVGGMANPFVLPGALPHHVGAHAISLPAPGGWEAWLASTRSSRSRNRIRAKRSALDQLGTLSFGVTEDSSAAKKLAALCFASRARQLAEARTWNPFCGDGVTDRLIAFFAGNVGRQSVVAALSLDGRPLAVALGLRDAREWVIYQMAVTGHDMARHSPGTLLLVDMMKHMSAAGLSRLDLTLGDEQYKAEWCDSHERLSTSIMAITGRGLPLAAGLRARSIAYRTLSDSPRLIGGAKRLQGLARRLGLPV